MTALRAFLRPIRQGAAMALVCALCLPLSQCKRGNNATPPQTKQTLESQFFPQSNSEFTYEYAVEELGFTLRGIRTLLAFTWPLLWILAGRKWLESRFAWILHSLELPLCFGTLYMLFVLTFGGDTLYGGYVAAISIGLFACTALACLACSLWRLGRRFWDTLARRYQGIWKVEEVLP